MPTEGYVEDRFQKGMEFEKRVEAFFRNLKDVKSVKRTDVSSKPHEYEDIRDLPASPDMEVYFDSHNVKVWITHKQFTQSGWKRKRSEYIFEMFWRYKTWRFMKYGEYALYGILNKDGTPHEVILSRVDDMKMVGTWTDDEDVNQDDLRAKLDMSKSIIIYKDGKPQFTTLHDIINALNP